MVEMDCPYCGKHSGQINNHVRMSKGDGHGSTGEYPDDWDRHDHQRNGADPEPDQAAETVDPHGDDPPGDLNPGGSEITVEQGDDLDPGEPDQSEREQLGFADDMSEKREYECGNCGEPLSYLGGDDREEGGKECPECGERLFWSMMEA